MPEIILPSVRQIANGTSEAQHAQLREHRETGRVQLWAVQGTAEECERDWLEFLTADCPGCVVHT